LWPALHDPLTASAALDENFVTFETCRLAFSEDGRYRRGDQAEIVISRQADRSAFMAHFADLLRDWQEDGTPSIWGSQ